MKYTNLKMIAARSLAAVLALLPACFRKRAQKEEGHDGHDHGSGKHESSEKGKHAEKK